MDTECTRYYISIRHLLDLCGTSAGALSDLLGLCWTSIGLLQDFFFLDIYLTEQELERT